MVWFLFLIVPFSYNFVAYQASLVEPLRPHELDMLSKLTEKIRFGEVSMISQPYIRSVM